MDVEGLPARLRGGSRGGALAPPGCLEGSRQGQTLHSAWAQHRTLFLAFYGKECLRNTLIKSNHASSSPDCWQRRGLPCAAGADTPLPPCFPRGSCWF